MPITQKPVGHLAMFPVPDPNNARRLRELLTGPDLLQMPCCFDALSARLVERAGFPLTFMSGFGVAAARLGLPDTGLLSYGEMEAQGRDICQAVTLPVIGDGDTGYGNAVNVMRTVNGYARAGFAGVMIEDQLSPKRCGHTTGKSVVDFDEACRRMRVAVDARSALRDRGGDIVLVARTDARAIHGLDEALRRAQRFADLGADVLFVEAPESIAEMTRLCADLPGVKMANMVEGGRTPVLPPAELQELGYGLAAYPLTLLNAAIVAMERVLGEIGDGCAPSGLLDFPELRERVGFDVYDALAERYASLPES
jgi:2-methylisocitrate lyase-like PEP mutase family enzyme